MVDAAIGRINLIGDAVERAFGWRPIAVGGLGRFGAQYGGNMYIDPTHIAGSQYGRGAINTILLATIGHEITHQLEKGSPEDRIAHERLRQAVFAYLRDGALETRRERESSAHGKDVGLTYAENEVVADVNGAMWLDPKFWRRLYEVDSGSTMRRVAYRFMEVATKLLPRLANTRFDAASFVTDVNAVREVAAQVWAERAQRNGKLHRLGAGFDKAAVSFSSDLPIDFGPRSFDELASEYAKMPETNGGRVIDADLVRELSPKYRADRSQAARIHGAASTLSKELYKKALSAEIRTADDSTVLMMAGGGGSGKSSIRARFRNEARPAAVLDGTMAKLDAARENIEMALATGRSVDIVFVYRSPEKAAEGAIRRAGETGRTVPISALASSHANAAQVLKQLAKQYNGDERVRIEAFWNDGEEQDAHMIKIEDIPNVTQERAEAAFAEATATAYSRGWIDPKQYAGFGGARSNLVGDGQSDSQAEAGGDQDFGREDAVSSSQATVNFEVAPDPNDTALIERWRGLSLERKQEISATIAKWLAPKVLTLRQAQGQMMEQVGSYLEDISPSFALRLSTGDVRQISHDLGYVLAQDSMMSLSDEEFEGSEVNQAVVLDLGEKSHSEIEEIYNRIREAVPQVGGQSFVDGRMIILNYSDVDSGELANRIVRALDDAYVARVESVYSSFPTKQEYDYASGAVVTGKPGQIEEGFRRGFNRLRGEATRAIREELDRSSGERRAGDDGARPANAASAEGGSLGAAGMPVDGQATRASVGEHDNGDGRQGRVERTGIGESASRDDEQDGPVASLSGLPTKDPRRVGIDPGPDAALVSVAERYAVENGITLTRQSEYATVDPEFADKLAEAYDSMRHDPANPVVAEAYANLIKQTTAQYRALEEAGYKFWLFDGDSDPYGGDPWKAMADLRKSRSMAVFSTRAGASSQP